MKIIEEKLDKMEILYTNQWKRLTEIIKSGNLNLLIEQTEALKKTYAKIFKLYLKLYTVNILDKMLV